MRKVSECERTATYSKRRRSWIVMRTSAAFEALAIGCPARTTTA